MILVLQHKGTNFFLADPFNYGVFQPLQIHHSVFQAKRKLYNDKILSSNDYEKVKVKIDKLSSNIITCNMPKKLMTKNYIMTTIVSNIFISAKIEATYFVLDLRNR